jgi:hypothetical protein
MLFFYASFSQKDSVYIRGYVQAYNSFKQLVNVKKAALHLKMSNGQWLECFSNDSGYYSFRVKPFSGKGELSVATDKHTSFVNGTSYGFLPGKDIKAVDFSNPNTSREDFLLQQVTICFSFPTICFKLHTAEPYYDRTWDTVYDQSNMPPEEAFAMMYDILKNNPLILEVGGNSSFTEKHPDSLSLLRANYVVAELVKRGIDKKQLTVKALGIKIISEAGCL